MADLIALLVCAAMLVSIGYSFGRAHGIREGAETARGVQRRFRQ